MIKMTIILMVQLYILSATTIKVTSSCKQTSAQQCSYIFIVQNYTGGNLTQITVDFTEQLYNRQLSQFIMENTTISKENTLFNKKLVGKLSPSLNIQNFTFQLTSMTNPPSLKPQYMNVTFKNHIFSNQLINCHLKVDQPSQFNFSFNPEISNIIGISNTVGIIFQVPQAYKQNTKLTLSMSYNISLINLSLENSQQTITNNLAGTKTILWNSIGRKLYTISDVIIINQNIATNYTLSGELQLQADDKLNYTIRAYTVTVQLQPAPYINITTESFFTKGGLSTQINISLQCAYQANKGYFLVHYSSSQLQATNTNICPNLSGICRENTLIKKSDLIIINSLKSLVVSENISNIQITTYGQINGNFYPFCRSTVPINLHPQSIPLQINLSSCNSSIVSAINTVNLIATAQSISIGDKLFIGGFIGVIDNDWTFSQNLYYKIINSSNIINNTSINVSMQYSNPPYVGSNSILIFSLYKTNIIYASMSYSSVSLCLVDTPKMLQNIVLESNMKTTFTKTVYTIVTLASFDDYQIDDYFYLIWQYYDNKTFQNDIFLTYQLNKPVVTVNSIDSDVTIINQYTIKVTFIQKPILKNDKTFVLVISGLNTLPIASELRCNISTYKSAVKGLKQTGISNNVTFKPISVIVTYSPIYFLKNNLVTVLINHPNRNWLSLWVQTQSTLTINLPFKCSNSNSNNSLSIAWNIQTDTFLSQATGSPLQLNVSLGTCQIGYFENSPSLFITDSIQGFFSTNNTVAILNKCINCSQCEDKNCIACFNSTYTSKNKLYINDCFQICPQGSYQLSTGGQCHSCHNLCKTCSESSALNCTACATNYQKNSNGYCQSSCEKGKNDIGLNGKCEECQSNCAVCILPTVCQICFQGAQLINNKCEFLVCQGQCATCTTFSTCTSCDPQFYLINHTCARNCPDDYYKDQLQSILVCTKISSAFIPLPATIISICLILLGIVIRCYTQKSAKFQKTAASKLVFRSDHHFYKLNLLRYSAVILSLVQVLSVLIMLSSGFSLNPISVNILAGLGLSLLLLCNILFGIAYYHMVWKTSHQIANTQNQTSDRAYSQIKLRQVIILVLSLVYHFRTYKLQYTHLFNEENLNQPFKQKPLIVTQKKQMKNQIFQDRKNGTSKISLKNNKNIIKRNSIQHVNIEQIIVKPSNNDDKISINNVKEQFVRHFMTYLIIISLAVCSTLFLSAGIVQVIHSRFLLMQLWGIDVILVILVSITLNVLDLWRFVNLKAQQDASQQHSIIIRSQENNTMQNLKGLTKNIPISINPELKQVRITKKITPKKKIIEEDSPHRKPTKKISNKKSIKKSLNQSGVQDEENLPEVKVFKDFVDAQQEKNPKENNLNSQYLNISQKKIRTKNQRLLKSTKQIGHKKRYGLNLYPKQGNYRESKAKKDDIYLGFMDYSDDFLDEKSISNNANTDFQEEKLSQDFTMKKMKKNTLQSFIKQSPIQILSIEQRQKEYQLKIQQFESKQQEKQKNNMHKQNVQNQGELQE